MDGHRTPNRVSGRATTPCDALQDNCCCYEPVGGAQGTDRCDVVIEILISGRRPSVRRAADLLVQYRERRPEIE